MNILKEPLFIGGSFFNSKFKSIYFFIFGECVTMNCIRFCVAAIAVSSLMFVGCGGSGDGGFNVTGSVKFSDGTPLNTGRVIFTSDAGESFGNIQSDGTVVIGELDGGVPAGTYTAIVSADETTEGSGKDGDYGTSVSLVAENSTSIEVKGNMTGGDAFTITVEKPKN
ncbi:MAG: hypothetical protein COA78_38280 [Blastopirellula sp.]|nr:MAG: hypothetical protein COA78_38280 [Blastopirellula sp.]